MTEIAKPTIAFFNRSYWPDFEATGQLLTQLSVDLSANYDVTVVAGHPNAVADEDLAEETSPAQSHGIRIRRVPHTRFSKRRLVGRIANYLTFAAGAAFVGATSRRADVIVVQTDPFLLIPLGGALAWLRGSKLVCYLQDIQPHVATALGAVRQGMAFRISDYLMRSTLRRATAVVVLSEDMAKTVRDFGVSDSRIRVIHNWADVESLKPQGEVVMSSGRPFVVMHSGNMGAAQNLDVVLDAAKALTDDDRIRFRFVGGGIAEKHLRERAKRESIHNVEFFPYAPRRSLAASLSSADLHIVSVDPRAVPYLMPSKLYGALAVGRPVVAVAPDDCELARVVRDGDAGWVADPSNAEAIAVAVREAASDPDELRRRGENARRLVVREFSRSCAVAKFRDVVEAARGERMTHEPSAVPIQGSLGAPSVLSTVRCDER